MKTAISHFDRKAEQHEENGNAGAGQCAQIAQLLWQAAVEGQNPGSDGTAGGGAADHVQLHPHDRPGAGVQEI